MDHIFAKIKRDNKKFFKLLSDNIISLYEDIKIDISICIPYDPSHNLDEDSWFKLENFTQQPLYTDLLADLLKNNFDSKDYTNLDKKQFSDITYIFLAKDNNFYFQAITPSLFIKRKLITFGDTSKIVEGDNFLSIKNQPDAIYFKSENTLVFRNLTAIQKIFIGIDQLYREATNQETEKFLSNDFIDLKDNYYVNEVSKSNRKRIALITDILAQRSEEDKSKIFEYIHSYCKNKLNIDLENKKITVSNNNELKLLLYGFGERFYTTPIGQEKRLANSTIPLG